MSEGPTFAAVADFNSDEILDLAVTCNQANTVGVMFGNDACAR